MSGSTLTFKAGAPGARVDLEKLIVSRLPVQANSGGGKSRLIRQLLEETHGRVQHLVIDPEGEFASLREKFDYILAAKTGGDTIASPKYARKLCRRLMELGASAVLDIYELSPPERIEFVTLFLDELVNLPRDLWRPALVVVDEAHMFAPEKGDAKSLDAMVALATRGRKRGFCAVFVERVRSLAAAGKSRSEIAIEVDRSEQTIGRTLRANGIVCADARSRKKRHRMQPGAV